MILVDAVTQREASAIDCAVRENAGEMLVARFYFSGQAGGQKLCQYWANSV